MAAYRWATVLVAVAAMLAAVAGNYPLTVVLVIVAYAVHARWWVCRRRRRIGGGGR